MEKKNSGNEALRQAVYQQRKEGNDIQVRVTWESSDIQRFVQEAPHDIQAQTIIAAGVMVRSIMSPLELVPFSPSSPPALALGIIPLGTANDFATSAQIPLEMDKALSLAIKRSRRSCRYY